MGKINLGRVVLGGLLAGLVINIGEFVLNEPILGAQWQAAMAALNRPEMSSTAVIGFWVVGFLLGIVMVWVYAAMRPRFNPGPKTAIIAGLTVWVVNWVLGFGTTLITGLFPANLVLCALAWGLFEAPIASLAGAWLYKEQ